MQQDELNQFRRASLEARILVLKTAKRVSGAHIGGIFSSLDFFICLLLYLKKNGATYGQDAHRLEGRIHGIDLEHEFHFVMSKGHCYLSLLACLDVVFGSSYTDSYLDPGTPFFGHPKRIEASNVFTVSSGSLGQGITFANGLALSNHLRESLGLVMTLCGDGEFNEGAVSEALTFAGHHKLNHVIFVDNNNQMSLDSTSNIHNNGDVVSRFIGLIPNSSKIDGHCHETLIENLDQIFKSNEMGPWLIDLTTIKGSGISFMEGVTKWHHRRFKGNEYEDALAELEKALLERSAT